jgi:hypothetical protein
VAVIVFILVRVSDLGREIQQFRIKSERESTAVQESLERVQAELVTAKELTPGLGEYMTTIQLHAGKVWFAAKASNWELADYELDELKETMEAAKALNAEKNGVKISGVLDAVIQTQVAQLADAIKRKSQTEFQKSYDETLSACNGCDGRRRLNNQWRMKEASKGKPTMTQLKEDRKDKLKDLWVSSNDFKRRYGPMAGAACHTW